MLMHTKPPRCRDFKRAPRGRALGRLLGKTPFLELSGGAHTLPIMPATLANPHLVRLVGELAGLERNPRTRVAMIAPDYLNRGWSVEEIVLQYP